MSWTATRVAGASWMSLSAGGGSSVANSTNIPLIDVGADVTNMAPGRYSGQIRIDSPGASNTPQLVTVTLNILARGTPLPPIIRPTGLIFIRQAGTTSPGSQSVTINTAVPGTMDAVSNPFDLKRLNWLTASPGNLTFSPTKTGQITVQPVLGKLTAGEYRGFIPIGFTDGTSQTVNVLFVVTSSPTTSLNSDDGFGFAAAGTCAPTKLYVAVRTITASFSSQAGFPQTIQAEVRDDCSNPVVNATTIAAFSNGDPSVSLVNVGNGVYEGTWTPTTPAGQVAVTVRAQSGTLSAAESNVSGQVVANAQAPAIASGGVVNAASFSAGAALSPGGIIAVYGANFASKNSGAPGFPVPTSLDNLRLNVGGRDVPLYFVSPGQVNAQIPFDMPVNFRPQAYVAVKDASGASEALTVPETITIAKARPGIFQYGNAQGIILDPFVLIDATNPAKPGQVVVIYSTGLGPVDQQIPQGQPAPVNPLANVTTPLTVTVGGVNAPVSFAGLTPSLVGLYQINVTIPSNVTSGSAVPVVITQDGVTSNTVTIPVRTP